MSPEENDGTNWRAWYWGIALFLVAQIILYIIISNQFGE